MFNIWKMKVGGIHFIRIGRFQMSFCVCKSYKPKAVREYRNTAERRARSITVGNRNILLGA
jgi:hypothetical protein